MILSKDVPRFQFIDPPFNHNMAGVSAYPPEVTGWHLMTTIRRRLGWHGFEGRSLLDFGCGVRFARTIVNLDIEIGRYIGVDVAASSISWLREHAVYPRLEFHHVDVPNVRYNPQGSDSDDYVLTRLGIANVDAACLMSVITHQNPAEARLTFRQIRRVSRDGGHLYLTFFPGETDEPYYEQEPNEPGHKSTYRQDFLVDLLSECGWRVEAAFPKSPFQQPALVCKAA